MRTRLGALLSLLALVVVMVAACGGTEDAGSVDAAYPTVSLSPTTASVEPEDAASSTAPSRYDDVYGGETAAPPTTDSSTPTTATTTTTTEAVTTTEAITATTASTTTTTTLVTTTAAAPEAEIEIEGFSFGAPLRVKVGTAVTVVNRDSVSHTWTSRDGVFDSGTLAPGDRFTYVFDQPGEFAFFCRIHPSMTGTITVDS